MIGMERSMDSSNECLIDHSKEIWVDGPSESSMDNLMDLLPEYLVDDT